MTNESISRNALRLWQIMNDGTTWCYNKLHQVSQLSDLEIYAVLGWLAREDTVEIAMDPVSKEETYKIRHFWEMGSY